jgi:hypothetical protein
MSTVVTARNACADPGAFHYQRHRPEKTLLYQFSAYLSFAALKQAITEIFDNVGEKYQIAFVLVLI